MRWLNRGPQSADDGGIGRLRQWAEINIAALYESHRQQKQRIDRLEGRVIPDPVSEQPFDMLADRVRELEARVRAIEEQPAAWSYPRQVEL